MATTQPTSGWVEVGRSSSSDKKNTVRAQVQLDEYYVVIGFEVNDPGAFKDQTHDLAKGYGHAFFSIVKNKIISKVFSFGPNGASKIGWFKSGKPFLLKNGYNASRPGTPDFDITEKVTAFKKNLTIKQGRKLEEETEKARVAIKTGKIRYTAYMNDTCAETAREVLSDADIDTPLGMGKVKHTAFLSFPVAYAVNPYMWHLQFKETGALERTYKQSATSAWHPPLGTWIRYSEIYHDDTTMY